MHINVVSAFMKYLFKNFKSFLCIIYIFVLFCSCQNNNNNAKMEEANGQKAVELVKNFNPSGKMSILDMMRMLFSISSKSTVTEIKGWYYEKTSSQVYRVTFIYIENTIEKRIEWAVNIETGQVSGIDIVARQFVEQRPLN